MLFARFILACTFSWVAHGAVGVIIWTQIENEYGPEGKEFGAAGKAYINWAAKMAVGLDTGVPWVMCKEDDAPDPVV